jgi:hypothetical protein
MALSLSNTQANIQIAGMASWYVRWGSHAGETTDEIFVSLGDLADGQFTQRALTVPNSYGRPKVYALEIEASAKMLNTTNATAIELLGTLVTGGLQHKITMINGDTFSGDWGTSWRFDSSADYDGNRYIEIRADQRILTAHASLEDWADVIDTPPIDGTPNGDVLGAWVNNTYHPAGISSLTIDPDGTGETPGIFRNGKLVAETLTTKDGQGRSIPYAIKVDIEIEMLQTLAEYAYMDDQFAGLDSWVLTMADGAVATFSSSMGIGWELNYTGNMDDLCTIRLMGSGILALSSWAGVWA